MGKRMTAILLALGAGSSLLSVSCAAQPTSPAVAPSLPPAVFHQITLLDASKSVIGLPFNPTNGCCDQPHATSPCVVDLRAALKATPEARALRSEGYSNDTPEYHMLLNRANERLRKAIREIASRHGYDMVMERGAVVLKAELTDVAVADITEEVMHLIAR